MVPQKPLPSEQFIAVFDESGRSSRPGPARDDDFALAAVIITDAFALDDLLRLDALLQEVVGVPDYKYRQVRRSTVARSTILDTLDRHANSVYVFGYYAGGGAFVRQAERELAASPADVGEASSSEAEARLARVRSDPWRASFEDALVTSVPAMSALAKYRDTRCSVFFDQRTDMAEVSSIIAEHIERINGSGIWGDSYTRMDWGGTCPEDLEPVARLADILVGDIRATFRQYGANVWKCLQADGFVGRHEEAAAQRDDVLWSGGVPMPRVGTVGDAFGEHDPRAGNLESTMFNGYRQQLARRSISLFSSDGIGCVLIESHTGDGYHIYQLMD